MKKIAIVIVAVVVSGVLFSRPIKAMLGKLLPWTLPYDAEVEYLESTGSNFIDTGVVCGQVYEITVDIIPLGAAGGTYIQNPNAGNRLHNPSSQLVIDQLRTTSYYGSARWWGPSNSFPANVRALIRYGNFYVYKNGSLLTTQTAVDRSSEIITENTLRIMIAKQKCYGVTVSNGGTLVRDFIPVRFTNEKDEPEGAMYDKVSGKLFRNQGTGNFIIGPDK